VGVTTSFSALVLTLQQVREVAGGKDCLQHPHCTGMQHSLWFLGFIGGPLPAVQLSRGVLPLEVFGSQLGQVLARAGQVFFWRSQSSWAAVRDRTVVSISQRHTAFAKKIILWGF